MSTMTARAFNQDVSGAKRRAREAPVVVTDRGEAAFVLLSIEDYRRLVGQTGAQLIERLRMDDNDEIDFPRSTLSARIPEL